MKHLMKHLLIIALSAFMFCQVQAGGGTTTEVNYLPEKVFVPSGFDDNDTIQIILEGSFPNSCYKSGPVQVKKDPESKEIQITHVAYKTTGQNCLMMIVPYFVEVDLGRLPQGDYQVSIVDEKGKKQMIQAMTVKKSNTSSADNFIYAPVEDISLVYPEEGRAPQLVISGTWTTNCAAFDRIDIIKDKDNIAVVLPILKYLSLPNCTNVTDKFRHVLEIPFELDETSLIHVRALNGRSLNIIGQFTAN